MDDKAKSLARLVYETKRSLQGRQHQVDKKRGTYGDFESSYPRKKASIQRAKKADKSGGYSGRERRKVSEQSIVEEIEGTGISGPVEGAQFRHPSGAGVTGLGPSVESGISRMTAEQKRALQKERSR